MGLRVLALQQAGWGAPATEDIAANRQALLEWTDRALSSAPADLAVLPELSTTPYFCCSREERFFRWAEPVPGPSTEAFSRLAERHKCTVVLPIFERAQDGRYYNAAAVIGSDGALLTGQSRAGPISPYRKCHIPAISNPPDTEAWEDYYFAPGPGFPAFQTDKVRLGVLICYDRWFPESWRILVSEGVELVVVPMVAWGFVETTYLAMLQSRAVENSVFVLTCNRAGPETLNGVHMDHFGRSAALAPDGTVIAIAGPAAGQLELRAELDLTQVERQRELLPLLRHRRQDLYGEPRQWTPDASSSTR
jgi:beta-ureidopropionase